MNVTEQVGSLMRASIAGYGVRDDIMADGRSRVDQQKKIMKTLREHALGQGTAPLKTYAKNKNYCQTIWPKLENLMQGQMPDDKLAALATDATQAQFDALCARLDPRFSERFEKRES